MKFQQLSFQAFGPFTDLHLDLNGEANFHLFYGPNEAGKSSMLRGIRSLLYGIETRTTDDFVHSKTDLRVGAGISHSDGRMLEIWRRKGNKNTLLAADGSPLEENALAPYLGAVDQVLFLQLYGLDHFTLVEGGRALLEGQGDVGQSLFAAGLGPSLRALNQRLQEEAQDLWRVKGKNYPLNQAMAVFKQGRKDISQKSLNPQVWKDLQKQLSSLDQELEKIENQKIEARREQNRLERYSEALRLVSQHRQLLQELQEFDSVPKLRPDFSSARRQLEQESLSLRDQLEKLESQLEACRRQLAEDSEQPALLSAARQIDELYSGLKNYQQLGQRTRDEQAELGQTTAEADALAADLCPGTARHHVKLPSAGLRTLCAEVSREFQATLRDFENAERRLAGKRRELEERKARLDSLGVAQDLPTLEQLDRELTGESKLDRDIREATAGHDQVQVQLQKALSNLPHFQGSLEALQEIRPMLADNIREFVEGAQELRRERTHLQDEIDKQTRLLEKIAVEKQKLSGAEAPPTRRELESRRQARDERGRELARLWEENTDWSSAAADWHSYTEAVAKTDSLADRLFTDAERVHRMAELDRRNQACADEIAGLQERLQKVITAQEDQATDWKRKLPGHIDPPLGPHQYESWLEARRGVLELHAEMQTRARDLHTRIRERDSLLQRAQGVFAAFDPTHTMVPENIQLALSRLQQMLAPLRDSARKRQALELEIQHFETELSELELTVDKLASRLQTSRERWRESLQQLGLNDLVDPLDLTPLLEKYERLGGLLAREQKLTATIDRLQKSLDEYRSKARDLARDLLPEQQDSAADRVSQALNEQLQEARERHQRRLHLQQQQNEWEQSAESLRERLAKAERSRQSLLSEAQAESAEQLPEIEEKARRRDELRAALDKLEASLSQWSAGTPLEEFSREVMAVDADLLPGLLAQKIDEVNELEARHGELREERGQKSQQLKHLTDDQLGASVSAAETEEAAAEVREKTERFMLLTLAHHLLNRQLEEYRRTHQGPILESAQASFEKLTQGFYPCLETGYDAKDNPVLLACERSGRKVAVDGLSDGTRDQLFLALRLATIEQQVLHHEPVPFVADDLLVHFDTERARAALQLLAQFSKKTQVLLFTHLERDLQLARDLPEGAVKIHELGRALVG